AEPLPPYERPPLSKAGSTDSSDPKFIAAAEKYIENGIRLLTGLQARDIDPASRTVTLSNARPHPLQAEACRRRAPSRPK
ncbi:ferredoxin reductase, partial [Rhizobium ruizarguesonis]